MIPTSSTLQKPTTQCSFLIIGYGNELRGDDGVGPRVAMTVADWRLPSVKSLAVHQLTPELAAIIAESDYVIFVDANHKCCAQTVQISPVVVSRTLSALYPSPVLAHHCEPSPLLTLTHMLYGRHPQAWLLQIPAECFEMGKSISDTAHQGIDRALRTIEQFFTTYLQPELCMKSA